MFFFILQVLHNICCQPKLIVMFTLHYDCAENSTSIVLDMVNALATFIQSIFINSQPTIPTTTAQGMFDGSPEGFISYFEGTSYGTPKSRVLSSGRDN